MLEADVEDDVADTLEVDQEDDDERLAKRARHSDLSSSDDRADE